MLNTLARELKKRQIKSYFINPETLIILETAATPQIIVKTKTESGEILLKVPTSALQLYFKPTTGAAQILKTIDKYGFFNDRSKIMTFINANTFKQ